MKLYSIELDELYNDISEVEIVESVFIIDGYNLADRLLGGRISCSF